MQIYIKYIDICYMYIKIDFNSIFSLLVERLYSFKINLICQKKMYTWSFDY